MSIQGINTGFAPNDGNGDSLLDGAVKINSNFSEIYSAFGDGSNLVSYVNTSGYSTTANYAVISGYSTSSGISTLSTTSNYAVIAGYSTNSGIASYAGYSPVSGIATNSNYAIIAGYSTSSGISTYATTAGISTYATIAGYSTTSDYAVISGYSTSSGIATYATTAGIATYATIAGYSTSSGVSTTSNYAVISGYSTSSGVSTSSSYATIAGYSTSSGIATYATTAGIATASTANFTVGADLYVTGNISFGGTSVVLNAAQLQVKDRDIVVGYTTDGSNNDVSNETTANHGGISVASTVGTPILNIPLQSGINTNPFTYKQWMWVKSGNYSGLGTDVWLSNYAVSIGNTSTVQNLSRLTVGAGFTVYDTYLDAQDIISKNINATGVVTTTSTLNVGTGGTVITTTTAGLVGIGTAVPGQKLEVSGNARIGLTSTASQYSTLSVIGDAAIIASGPTLSLVGTDGLTRYGYLYHSGSDLYLTNQQNGNLLVYNNNT